MIVSICADKDSGPVPLGVSTLTLALAALWPGQRLVLEADPSGGDTVFRLLHADGGLLHADPTLLSLAADARAGLNPSRLPDYAQPTALDVPVILAPPTGDSFASAARLWPQFAQAAALWPGTVLADLGRLQPATVGGPLLAASSLVLMVSRADVAGLYRLRDRVLDLSARLAPAPEDGSRLVVVVRSSRHEARSAVAQVSELLESIGSPALLGGVVLDDPRGAAGLASGQVAHPARGWSRGGLLSSVRDLRDALPAWSFAASATVGSDGEQSVVGTVAAGFRRRS